MALLVVLAGCSGGGGENEGDEARDVLADAKRQLDAAPSARFTLKTENVPEGTAALVAGEGLMARPDKFQGNLEVSIGNGTASVSIISVGGRVYAKLPFAQTYTETDPERFGLGDPGNYMDPKKGLSTLLLKATDAKIGGTSRVDGEVVQEVTAKIPGKVIDDLLTSADPTKPVAASFALTRKTGEVRRVQLKGPFFQQGVNSTLTIVLDRYGDPVDIRPPPDATSP